jgi:hypothetical protein
MTILALSRAMDYGMMERRSDHITVGALVCLWALRLTLMAVVWSGRGHGSLFWSIEEVRKEMSVKPNAKAAEIGIVMRVDCRCELWGMKSYLWFACV